MLQSKVEEVIAVVRPIIQADAGDVVLHGVDEERGIVTVELTGACVTCPASSQTLKAGLERILRDRVPGIVEVVNIGETLDAMPGDLAAGDRAGGGPAGGAAGRGGPPKVSPVSGGPAATSNPPISETAVSL